jgi:ribose/xylose/arabinose/galactoside ABC-type transport system permease subunit
MSGIVLLNRSWIGAYALGMGENPTASVFAGVPVRKLTIFLYALSGFWCGVAAPIYLSFNQTALPEMKRGMELDVIAAVVVGGTRITGGQASVVGTFLSVLLLGTLQYAMQMREPAVPQFVQDVVTGLVVVVAAVFNEVMARREERLSAVAVAA